MVVNLLNALQNEKISSEMDEIYFQGQWFLS